MPRARSLLLVFVAVPLLVGGAALALGVGRGDEAACVVETFPEQEGGHLPEPPAGFEYASFPPTSGPSAERPEVWDAYPDPVSQFRLVHNLLHGGVAVQYGGEVDGDTLVEVHDWYSTDPAGIVLAPLPRLGDSIVLTAWRTRATCSGFQERAFTSFRDRHRFNGPERPAREAMARGQGGVPNPLGLRVTPSPVRARATFEFSYADSATVSIAIRRGTAGGEVVRRLPNVTLLPGRPVRLAWDVTADDGSRVPPGTYVAVARLDAPERETTSETSFDVR